MRISDIGGEFGWISRIARTAGGPSADMPVPLGDDAAVIETPPGRQTVVTTDMLVEGTHFRRDWSDPESIGWKCAAVNVSDIAAMGAVPTYAFVALCMTPTDTVEFMDGLYKGLLSCLHTYGCALGGGDTNGGLDRLVVAVTQLGHVQPGRAWRRDTAQLGDIICVTGTLGDSALGLHCLQHPEIAPTAAWDWLCDRHRRPSPQTRAALAMAETGHRCSAMDISDGFAGDLGKLCQASHVGATVQVDALPVSAAARIAAAGTPQSVHQWALTGGEDFELLIAAAPESVSDLQAACAGVGVTLSPVGEITQAGLACSMNGQSVPWPAGWDHFAA